MKRTLATAVLALSPVTVQAQSITELLTEYELTERVEIQTKLIATPVAEKSGGLFGHAIVTYDRCKGPLNLKDALAYAKSITVKFGAELEGSFIKVFKDAYIHPAKIDCEGVDVTAPFDPNKSGVPWETLNKVVTEHSTIRQYRYQLLSKAKSKMLGD